MKNVYLSHQKARRQKYLSLILAAIALLASIFVIINRLPKKSESTNTNNTLANTVTINKNTNQHSAAGNQNSNNANTAPEPIIEVTNTAANAVKTFAGTPPEITKGDSTKKQVIFTFDAGSGNQSAQTILDTLDKYHLEATFFLTGKWAEKNGELAKQIARQGHEVFNHTYSHPHLTQISDEEIIDELNITENIIFDLTGKTTKPYFRPPYGERNAHVLEIAAGQGYQSVFWTIDALDWKESEGVTADQVKNRIFSNLQPGVIYLMHVGDNLTGQVLEEVIKRIQGDGYNIVPLSQGVE